MSPAARLFVDVSYTRTQTGNVGITRTVRQLLAQFQAMPGSELDVTPVAYHATGFRRAMVP